MRERRRSGHPLRKPAKELLPFAGTLCEWSEKANNRGEGKRKRNWETEGREKTDRGVPPDLNPLFGGDGFLLVDLGLCGCNFVWAQRWRRKRGSGAGFDDGIQCIGVHLEQKHDGVVFSQSQIVGLHRLVVCKTRKKWFAGALSLHGRWPYIFVRHLSVNRQNSRCWPWHPNWQLLQRPSLLPM